MNWWCRRSAGENGKELSSSNVVVRERELREWGQFLVKRDMSAGGLMPGSPPSRVSQTRDGHDPESPSLGKRPGPWPPRIDNEQQLAHGNGNGNNLLRGGGMGSWARRTGFKGMERGASNGSDIEINLSDGTAATAKPPSNGNIAKANHPANGAAAAAPVMMVAPPPRGAPPGPFVPGKMRGGVGADSDVSRNNSGQLRIEPLRIYKDQDDALVSQSDDEIMMMMSKHSHMKYELRETPGLCKQHLPRPLKSPRLFFLFSQAMSCRRWDGVGWVCIPLASYLLSVLMVMMNLDEFISETC